MKTKKEYFFCSPKLLRNIDEIREIDDGLGKVTWKPEFSLRHKDRELMHQRGYNKAFEIEFQKLGWELQPKLYDKPRLIGDFRKNDVFIEVQFGNSATLYRDYYKFHYGLTYNLLSLAVLIVPTDPQRFFPTRGSSVQNMAEYAIADQYFRLLPIPVPILLIGLPEN